MIKYSIVIPTFGRPSFLKNCLESIKKQSSRPHAVNVIDNNSDFEMRGVVKKIVNDFNSDETNYNYVVGRVNSGAVARNHGASLTKTKLVAFLDDDVVLDIDYYEKILDVFDSDNNIVGVQGLDHALVENYKMTSKSYIRRLGLFIENIFEHSFIIKKNNSDLRPSLAVTHPIPTSDFFIESQWISTCAGVFKTELFNVLEFPENFVKYSWNEYVFFSHSIYKKNLGNTG